MEQHDFTVTDIQGDYAFLRQTDQENDGTFQVAMALLPPETDIGTKLRGFMGMFEVIE
ncbi:MAG: chorismate--pyruvate lyase [Oscillospiraceae bacterium]|nr:chorismate--pyruvate lyase [Oscillospiraceae bacterium]